MATIKFQNSLNWYIWFTLTSYQCWLNPLKTQAIFIILVALVIKHVQRVLPKLHAKRAIIRTLTVTYGTLQKNKRSSVLNLSNERQVCPSLFFQFNMCIFVIYGTLRVSCNRVVNVLSPLASNSSGHICQPRQVDHLFQLCPLLDNNRPLSMAPQCVQLFKCHYSQYLVQKQWLQKEHDGLKSPVPIPPQS